jgi:hypothetical protein
VKEAKITIWQSRRFAGAATPTPRHTAASKLDGVECACPAAPVEFHNDLAEGST